MKHYKVVTVCISSKVEYCCNDLHKEGYDVVSVVFDGNLFVITGKLKGRSPHQNLRGPGMP